MSTGAIVARHSREIPENTHAVLAVELICACQGIDLRGVLPGRRTGFAHAHDLVRERLTMLHDDCEPSGGIARAIELVQLAN